VPYDNGSTYTLTSPGLSGQVLHGGAAPSFGPVALSDISASVAVLNSAQNWSAAQTFMASGPVKINNVSDTFASTLASAATASRTFTLPDVTDTACGISATQTLSNKTLTTPVIASFTNAQHNHTTAAQGGSITVAAIADIAANYQPLSSDLIAIAALSATPGMLSRTGAATFAQRTLACSNATCSWTNGDGAAGAPTLLLNVGTGANSLCAGNDVRLGPAPSGGNSGQCLQSNGSALVYGACGGAGSLPSAGVAGRIPYDNGVSYSLASAGTSSQVLVGGTTPAFGAVNLTSMVTGILPSGNLPANNAYLNVTQNWSAPQTFQNAGPIKINNAADTFATTLATAASAARTFTLPDATDTACGLATTQTLSNKTLTTPVIASFTNAQHTHTNAAGGGVLDAGAITTGTFANARLTNPATTVNGQTCTLGSTCTVTVSLTTGVTGILPIGNGGTNSGTTLTGNRLMTSNSGATAIVEGNIYDWVVPEVTSTTTGGGVVDTTFTIPAAQGSDGTNGFLVSDLDFRVTRAPGGGGTVNIRCGLSAGGTELIVSTSAATLGQVIGDAVTELGTACPAAKQYNCYVNGAATVTCRLEAPVGTVSTALKGVWTFTGKRR
jgi:S-ribosylhomocysteine lyase LuxS involved in autoinducer biosynthesis